MSRTLAQIIEAMERLEAQYVPRLRKYEALETAVRRAHDNEVQAALRALEADAPAKTGIYIASKVKHAARWRHMRTTGWPIISTWIDEAGVGETLSYPDLWDRCIGEASHAAVCLLYIAEGETMKGGLIEAGAALASGVPVIVCGEPPGTFRHHRLVSVLATWAQTLDALRDRGFKEQP
jgi:hypothetical protein